MQGKVYFFSEGLKVEGILYGANSASPRPGIVVCHGFAGVKETTSVPVCDKFNSLPPDAQKIIQQAAREAVNENINDIKDIEEKAVKELPPQPNRQPLLPVSPSSSGPLFTGN